ncbi:MAG: glycosyltransferase [Fibrobacter sp.]|nr:glycosyltransferase [Fibrobacter sp.]
MTKISIIIPTYKTPIHFLQECLKSLQSQKMNECEFIIISDGATAEECKLCIDFSKNDSRFLFFDNAHSGVSSARNIGIQHASGEYITFLDADDWIDSTTCLEIYNNAKQNKADLLFWDCVFHKENSFKHTCFSQHSIEQLSDSEIETFKKNIIHVSQQQLLIPAITVCKLFRTSIIKQNKLYYNESLVSGEDRVFNLQFVKYAKNFSYLNKAFYHYRIHNQSFTNKFNKNYLHNAFEYIGQLEKSTNNLYKVEIANELFEAYCIAWNKCYCNKENTDTFSNQMRSLTEFLQEHNFFSRIQFASVKGVQSIEWFFLKRKQTFIIWLHGLIKNILLNTIFPKH